MHKAVRPYDTCCPVDSKLAQAGPTIMISKQSPEGQVLTVAWRTLLNMAGPVSEQYRWMLAGIAAIIALMVANLSSLQQVVRIGCLKWSLIFLVIAVVLAALAYLLSTSLKAGNEVVLRLEQAMGTQEAQNVLAQMSMDHSDLMEQLAAPFFGPMKWILVRAAKNGAKDEFAFEKRGIILIMCQAYSMWLSLCFAAVGLVVLVAGLN